MSDYYDLGSHTRPVTTDSAAAQRWFDRGLMWCYGYNHEEAMRCFQKATANDPSCAMAHWGAAYASGSNYNKSWEDFEEGELRRAVADSRVATEEALAYLAGTTRVEQALIRALEKRYQSDQVVTEDEFHAWNDDYAAAMREVYAAFPDDLDVGTLFAEAMINRTPWQLWDLKSGEPAAGADTLEAVAVLERGIEQVETNGLAPHPGLLHMCIHVMEMSAHSERALRAADALCDVVPKAGHLLHMPSHIYVLCGLYHDAVVANSKAIVADQKYLEDAGPLNFYTLYRCHDYHFKLYSAMFLGQYRAAMETADGLAASLPAEVLRLEDSPMADWLEGFASMKMHVLVRFGRWREIIDTPLPDDPKLYSVTTCMIHYAKAIALAASGEGAAAEREQRNFAAAYAKIPETRYVFNNPWVEILTIAAEMLEGEIRYRKGDFEPAFDHLRRAVELDDDLDYDEPWGWMQPARHALGALLLEQGQVEEAAQIYRADLGLIATLTRPSQHPENVWSLHGYVECLHKLHQHEEATAMQPRLDLALARADVTIEASCYCRVG